MSSSLAVLSFFCIVLAYLPLWARITRDNEKPPAERDPLPKATWLVWLFVDAIFVLEADGVETLQMLAYACGTGWIAREAWRRGEKGLDTRDKTILAVACSALVCSMAASSIMATLLVLTAASIGAWPLLRDMQQRPGAHGIAAWLLFWLGGLFGILAIFASAKWTWAQALASIGLFPIQTAMLAFALRRRRPCAVVYEFVPRTNHARVEYPSRLAA